MLDPKDANPTNEEIEAAKKRPHLQDRKDFISTVKKIVKSKDIRINKYVFKELWDGFMLKIEAERFMGGVSMGTRMIKGYLTIPVKETLEKLIDAIPKREYTDSRDGGLRHRPLKIERKYEEKVEEIIFANLWDEKEKG